MNQTHYNELVLLSQEICDHATDKLTNFCAGKYCGVGNDTTEQQLVIVRLIHMLCFLFIN